MNKASQPCSAALPCSLSEKDRGILRLWSNDYADSLSAYVSQRRGDQTLLGKVVVFDRVKRKPLYSVHQPTGSDLWIVTALVEEEEIGCFRSLHDALSFVRPASRGIHDRLRASCQ